MKTYKLITTSPLAFVAKNLGGLPTSLITNTPPLTPDGYAYVEELAYPSLSADVGNIWTRQLTLSAYGWVQTAAPPEPDPEWYVQPAWRIRAVADVEPYGEGLLIDAITAAIDAIVDPFERAVAKEVFFGGNTLDRQSTVLTDMASGLGLTDEQVDNLFLQADAIVV